MDKTKIYTIEIDKDFNSNDPVTKVAIKINGIINKQIFCIERSNISKEETVTSEKFNKIMLNITLKKSMDEYIKYIDRIVEELRKIDDNASFTIPYKKIENSIVIDISHEKTWQSNEKIDYSNGYYINMVVYRHAKGFSIKNYIAGGNVMIKNK